MSVDELINKLQNTLNKLINENDLSVKTIELLNELLETLKIIENCIGCKDKKMYGIDFDKIENCLVELEKEDIVNGLNIIDFELNKKKLCEGCKGKIIDKLTDKCGNEEIARFLYQCKLNKKHYYNSYIQWIPFDRFKNIEYLAEGGFGEVHKATWINSNSYYIIIGREDDDDVVLKRIYNNSSDDKIVDILN